MLRGSDNQSISYLAVVALLRFRPLSWRPSTRFSLLTRSPRYVVRLPTTRRRHYNTHAPPGPSLREFSTLSVDDIINGVRQLPDKSSAADSLPTFVLKPIIDLIAPFVTELFRRSLVTGRFHSRFKDASITPIVKKVGLDPSDASSYRPISNLAVLSKLLKLSLNL